MNAKVFLLLLLHKWLSISAQTEWRDDNPIFRDCETPDYKPGYCVQIYNCLSLLQTHNITLINRRRCGPPNEDKKNPEVCCDVDLVQLASKSPRVTCGVQNVTIPSRIFGGGETLPGEFPWMARLLRKDDINEEVKFSCSGALIGPKVVITTAHCLVSPGLDSLGPLYAVTLGEHETECGFGNVRCLRHKKTIKVAETIVHPGYKIGARNHDNDIALIILEKEVEMSDFIAPICVLEGRYESDYYTISGWGKTEDGGMSSTKLKTSLPPYSWQQCVDKFKDPKVNVNLTSNHVCAGGVKGQDSCQGDSGGPLMAFTENRWYLAGLVSFGIGCGREGWPGVYTNVPNYANWLRGQLKQRNLENGLFS